jgi:broad specificity phosphatase PhoE
VIADREVWLIRHAESAWNALGRWQGQSDPGLSARGRTQARALAGTLAGARLAALYTSDLRRASETAACLAATLALEPRPDPRLRERDLGAWSGLTTPQIAGRFGDDLARLRAHDPELRPGGGESTSQVRARLRRFLEVLAAESGGGPIALVTHGGVIASLLPGVRAANGERIASSLGTLLAGAAEGSGAGPLAAAAEECG